MQGLAHLDGVEVWYMYISKPQSQQHWKHEIQSTAMRPKNVPVKETTGRWQEPGNIGGGKLTLMVVLGMECYMLKTPP